MCIGYGQLKAGMCTGGLDKLEVIRSGHCGN